MLPEPGGARDQHPGELQRLRRLYNIWRAVWMWDRKGPDVAKWIEANPSEWETVQDIMEMEENDSGS